MKPKLTATILLLTSVLFSPAAVGATIILFDDYRSPGTIDYIGSYTTNGSFLTSFSVAFGDCDICLYDRPGGGAFPDGTGPFHESVFAHVGQTQMNYYPKSRTFDSFVGAWGKYCVVGVDCDYADPGGASRVPEPAGVWLLVVAVFVARYLVKRLWR